MTARRESFKGQFLVKGFPTSSGRSDPARRSTEAAFSLLPLWDAVESTIDLPRTIGEQGNMYDYKI